MRTKNYLLVLFILMSSVVFPQTGVTTSGSFMVNGVVRTYTYYVPAIYNSSTAVPLVMNLHGLSGTSAKQEHYMDFRSIADTANFIVVHPQGEEQSPLPTLYSAPGWGVLTAGFATVPAGRPDREFILRLVDTIRAKYNINSNRIYSSGYSQGGFLSQHLALLNDHPFAAIASVSGGLAFEYIDSAKRVHAIPVMEIHGTVDGTISYTGGVGYMGVDSLIKHWVCYNNCNTAPTIDTLANVNTADGCFPIHYVYSGGVDGATVELYKISNGGHQVPSDVVTLDEYGLGARNRDFKASKEIWRFFRKYSLNMFTGIPTKGPCIMSATPITSISEGQIESDGISIYPNPSNGLFTLNLKNTNNSIVRIVNVLGETVLEKKISDASTVIDLSDAPAGLYFYQASNQSGIVGSGKLIVK